MKHAQKHQIKALIQERDIYKERFIEKFCIYLTGNKREKSGSTHL